MSYRAFHTRSLTADKPELVNPIEQAVSHDSLSIAFLVLLESLLLTERAVFLLHVVFIYSEGEAVNLIHVIAGRKLSAVG